MPHARRREPRTQVFNLGDAGRRHHAQPHQRRSDSFRHAWIGQCAQRTNGSRHDARARSDTERIHANILVGYACGSGFSQRPERAVHVPCHQPEKGRKEDEHDFEATHVLRQLGGRCGCQGVSSPRCKSRIPRAPPIVGVNFLDHRNLPDVEIKNRLPLSTEPVRLNQRS